jgi:hypothetical protein
MANVEGKVFAITATTPMQPWKTHIVRVMLWVIRRLGVPKRDQERLAGLSFIHFARWVLIPRGKFPHVSDRQPKESLHYDYMLFCSNFNGSLQAYIEAFSQVIPGGMNNIWRWSVKYPGSKPITPFLGYIYQNQYDDEYTYSAAPGASTTDIMRALELKKKLDAFTTASRDLSPRDFEVAFYRFFASVQHCLGTTGVSQMAKAADLSTPAMAPEDFHLIQTHERKTAGASNG